jgi:hypothetical protein
MCFQIDYMAPKSTKKFAHKVLRVNSAGNLVSEQHKFRHVRWTLGKTKRLPKSISTYDGDYRSHEGLYVNTTRKRALDHLRSNLHCNGGSYVLVLVSVDPADYIHSSFVGYAERCDRAATYYALTPIRIVKAAGLGSLKPAARAKVKELMKIGRKAK